MNSIIITKCCRRCWSPPTAEEISNDVPLIATMTTTCSNTLTVKFYQEKAQRGLKPFSFYNNKPQSLTLRILQSEVTESNSVRQRDLASCCVILFLLRLLHKDEGKMRVRANLSALPAVCSPAGSAEASTFHLPWKSVSLEFLSISPPHLHLIWPLLTGFIPLCGHFF